jgi:hypothetical protein
VAMAQPRTVIRNKHNTILRLAARRPLLR